MHLRGAARRAPGREAALAPRGIRADDGGASSEASEEGGTGHAPRLRAAKSRPWPLGQRGAVCSYGVQLPASARHHAPVSSLLNSPRHGTFVRPRNRVQPRPRPTPTPQRASAGGCCQPGAAALQLRRQRGWWQLHQQSVLHSSATQCAGSTACATALAAPLPGAAAAAAHAAAATAVSGRTAWRLPAAVPPPGSFGCAGGMRRAALSQPSLPAAAVGVRGGGASVGRVRDDGDELLRC